MTIRISRSLPSKTGTTETSSTAIEKETILIGRGGESELLLDGRGISLQHARITRSDGSYVIEDLESLSGVSVNDKLVRRHVIGDGDILKFATHRFKTSLSGADLELQELEREDTASAEETLRQQIKKLDFKSALPSMKALCWGGIVLALALSFHPIITENRLVWSSGQITNHHKIIEADCTACHDQNYLPIKDKKCLSCHEVSAHSKVFSDQNASHKDALDKPCISCHREHNGEEALVARESTLCTSCHANLQAVLPATQMAAINSWEDHPEFSVRVRKGDGESSTKVRLSDTANLKDASHLKLNHELHLKKDLRGKDGLVTLQCNDCHKLAADHRSIEPLSMENHCSSCHTLEFDEHLPGSQVPHGDPNVVYKYLYAEYAKLMLEGAEEQSDSTRQRPGAAQAAVANPTFARTEIVKQARHAERELFTRTACKLCHEISELSDETASDKSRFAVLKPEVPTTWMPAALFSHGAHEEVSCEGCHEKVRTSTQTEDVLLPGIKDCRACHAGHATTGKVTSNCVDCHSYHDSLPLDLSRKHTLEKLVKTLRSH